MEVRGMISHGTKQCGVFECIPSGKVKHGSFLQFGEVDRDFFHFHGVTIVSTLTRIVSRGLGEVTMPPLRPRLHAHGDQDGPRAAPAPEVEAGFIVVRDESATPVPCDGVLIVTVDLAGGPWGSVNPWHRDSTI